MKSKKEAEKSLFYFEKKENKPKIDPNSSKVDKKGLKIPSYIFKDRSLSVLEIISEYLKDYKNLTYHEIAVLVNRDDRTIWTVYNRAKKKREKSKIKEEKDFIAIPIEVLIDRKLSVLEVLVEYLKEKHNMTYHEIAVLTNRDDRTIWTVYNRAKKKRK